MKNLWSMLLLFRYLCFSVIISSVFGTKTIAYVKPNIIFVLADDVGWSDFGYNNPNSPIPSPFIDSLAAKGIQMKQYYSHSLCTPARASIMAGRYHVNTGMNYVLAVASPGGLSPTIPTIPSLLKQHGYSTAMTGKWHLGHAQHKMTPIGHGFDSFTGNFMWDVDYHSKQLYEAPWNPLAIDWISEHANGTYRHYAEPRHATEAVTSAAQNSIREHVATESEFDPEDRQPLFLYVAYTAPHSPLQPRSEDEAKCSHISQEWRRKYCGLVVGLDEGIRNITSTALDLLGENLLMVVASDNGAVPWFGGMNAPLRGSKATPLEGGVRVPALIVDFTRDRQYLGNPAITTFNTTNNNSTHQLQRVYHGLMHSSDWLPTLLSYANVPAVDFPAGLDGFDFSEAFRAVGYQSVLRPCQNTTRTHEASSAAIHSVHDTTVSVSSPRSEILLEMYYETDFIFGEQLQAFRLGDWKYINGIIRDESHYHESSSRWLNMTGPSLVTAALQIVIPLLEAVFGVGPVDALRLSLVHINLQGMMTKDQKSGHSPTLRLYHLPTDPLETHNLALLPEHAGLIALIEEKLEIIKLKRPEQQKVYMQFHLFDVWKKTHVSGDCSMNPSIKPGDCRFTHSWIPDDLDPFAIPGTLSITDYTKERSVGLRRSAIRTVCIALFVFVVVKRVDIGDWRWW